MVVATTLFQFQNNIASLSHYPNKDSVKNKCRKQQFVAFLVSKARYYKI